MNQPAWFMLNLHMYKFIDLLVKKFIYEKTRHVNFHYVTVNFGHNHFENIANLSSLSVGLFWGWFSTRDINLPLLFFLVSIVRLSDAFPNFFVPQISWKYNVEPL